MDRWAQRGDVFDVGRRRVAVLFAGLCGFAEFVESAGPEVAVELVAPVMGRLVALAQAHSGVIQQVVGDGFMSVYGLRPGGGNEAVQAVRAARALLGEAGETGIPPIRAGIECGEVMVSRSWLPCGFAVWGGAVTAARQLCELARPGAVWIGPRTIELAGPDIGVMVSNRYSGVEVEAGRGGHRETGGRRRLTPDRLTRTELVVARLVAEGLSNPQIAQRLHISRHTAETHMKHIFAKLHLSSRAELAARVASRLFVDEP